MLSRFTGNRSFGVGRAWMDGVVLWDEEDSRRDVRPKLDTPEYPFRSYAGIRISQENLQKVFDRFFGGVSWLLGSRRARLLVMPIQGGGTR